MQANCSGGALLALFLPLPGRLESIIKGVSTTTVAELALGLARDMVNEARKMGQGTNGLVRSPRGKKEIKLANTWDLS